MHELLATHGTKTYTYDLIYPYIISAGIEKFAALKREENNLTSPIRALHGAKNISETIDVTWYPLMHRKGINLCDNLEMQVLLRELVSLNDEVESVSVLEFAAYNDAPHMLLKVPRSSWKGYFAKNATRTGWIEKLLSVVLPEELEANDELSVEDNLEDEDEIEKDHSIAAWWLLRHLGTMYPDEFIKAANDIGMSIHSKPIDQDEAFTMFRDATIGVQAA
jgi:hypothetical protein